VSKIDPSVSYNFTADQQLNPGQLIQYQISNNNCYIFTKSRFHCICSPVCWNCRHGFLRASSASRISGSENVENKTQNI